MTSDGNLRFRVRDMRVKLLFWGGPPMNIENRLRRLESHYRVALSAAVAAKGRFLALQGELGSTAAAIGRAKAAWQTLESRKAFFAAQMAELEKLEHDAVT